MKFEYFKGPEKDMAGLCKEEMECSLCGKKGRTFELDFANIPGSISEQREGKFGCYVCLNAGRFEFRHDSDIGMIDEETTGARSNDSGGKPFPESAIYELRHTPEILTWQEEHWLTHCNDFMVYQGIWEPKEFYENAPDGDGRKLFHEMVTDFDHLWDESLPKGETILKSWYASFYTFKCKHCGVLKGYWDCD